MKHSAIPIEKIAAWVITLAGILFALSNFLAPIFYTLLPFILAWAMAYLARPLALRLHRYARLSVGAWSVLLVYLFLAGCCLLLFLAAKQAVIELAALGERFTGADNLFLDGLNRIEAWCADITARLPMLGSFSGDSLHELLFARLASAGEQLGEWALCTAGALASALPDSMIFLLVTLVAAFYFSLDLGNIHRALLAHIPQKWQMILDRLKNGTWQTALGYLRAYCILLLVTFCLLLLGFLFLRIPYAVLLAAVIAVLDLLPIIGVGTVLLPWGIFALLCGNAAQGIGLLALFAVMALVRQFLEPRLIGHHLGLHPLLALFATYAGLKLFGFWGLMLLPGACMILRHAWIKQGPPTK